MSYLFKQRLWIFAAVTFCSIIIAVVVPFIGKRMIALPIGYLLFVLADHFFGRLFFGKQYGRVADPEILDTKAAKMTPAQIAEAQELVRKWQQKQ